MLSIQSKNAPCAAALPMLHLHLYQLQCVHSPLQEERDILLTADIGGTNCRFSLWAAYIRVDVTYDEIFTKVRYCQLQTCLQSSDGSAGAMHMPYASPASRPCNDNLWQHQAFSMQHAHCLHAYEPDQTAADLTAEFVLHRHTPRRITRRLKMPLRP